jgi:hypothetical protein
MEIMDNQGEEKNGVAKDMDMDNKEKDTEAAPKGNDQDGSNSHNGGEGMQEQGDFLEAIQFGTMDAKCASPGITHTAKNLNQIDLVFIPKSNIKVHAQNDSLNAVSYVDLQQRGDSPGLLGVGIGEPGQFPAIGQELPVATPAWHAGNGPPPVG